MMTTTTSLTGTHLLILHHAAHRPEGRVLPLPDGIGNKGGSATRALQSLLRRELLQQEVARTDDQEWARARNGNRLTLTITPAGRAAIGVTETVVQADGGSAGSPESDPILAQSAPQVAKADGKHMQERRGKSP